MQKRRVSIFLIIGVMALVAVVGGGKSHAQQNPTGPAAVQESASIPPERIPQAHSGRSECVRSRRN